MIEVKARIVRRCVFIPEETLQCEIIFTNYGWDKNKTKLDEMKHTHARSASDTRLYAPELWIKSVMKEGTSKDETSSIAWASAQIYCQCDINQRKLKLPVFFRKHSTQEHATKNTSFTPVLGETGHCLYSTEATVLFCDLDLKKGETKKFIYSQLLPKDIPPSYKGQHIKLSYKVSIGIGRINQPLCIIRLPFRLFDLKGIFKYKKEKNDELPSDNPYQCSTPLLDHTFMLSKNPFLEENRKEKYSYLDVAMDALTSFTMKRNLNTYNIQSTNGTVGKFCLSKHYYRLGEDILGTFDFSESLITLVKYNVSLQVEETVSKSCLIQPSSSNLVHYITLSQYEECCYMTSKTNFLLPIPITATPEFTHKIVSVRWHLHFEFLVESIGSEILTENTKLEKRTDLDNVPLKLHTESMLWDLPLHVVATNPIQASLMMQADSSEIIHLEES